MAALYDTLVQRRIWRVLVAYPSVTFIWLQVFEFFINNYDFDQRWLTVSLIIAGVFFPAAVVWNWRHGEVGDQPFSRPEIGAYVTFAVVAMVGASWYWETTPASMRAASDSYQPARTLAVMPFENAGNDAEVQFLCDGIAENLINWLATVPDVKVISKSAAFRLRDDVNDVAKIAAALGVDGVIRGRLERIGEQIVISTTFVDTRDDSQVWGERMVRQADEVIFLERSIVDAIKDGLRLEVSDTVAATSPAAETDHPAAYQHYLRGHFLKQSTNTAEVYQGLDELRAAIRIDPQYARPYADIADTLSQMLYFGVEHDDALIAEARNAAYTAVALAPQLPEAQTALASMNQYLDLDWRAADAAFDSAVALAPQSPDAYYRYADYLIFTLRTGLAREMAARAIALDALDSSAMHAVGFAALIAGDFSTAARALGEWNRFHPNSRWSYIKHAVALALDGQCDIALSQADKVENMLNHDPGALMDSWLAWGYKVCEHDERYARSIQRITSKRDASPDSLNPGFAYMYALEGDVDSLLELLNHVVDERSPLTFVVRIFKVDYLAWGISGQMGTNPEFVSLLEKLNFPPEN